MTHFFLLLGNLVFTTISDRMVVRRSLRNITIAETQLRATIPRMQMKAH